MKVTKCPPAYDPELEYDRHSFERRPQHSDLLGLVDYSDANRTQFFEAKVGTKEIPAWVRDINILNRVLYSHPQARKLASKWAKILYLYYFLSYTSSDVAENMGLTKGSVEWTLQALNKRATSLC